MKEKYDRFEIASLIPRYWELPARDVKDIIFLGKSTIHEMIRFWKKEKEETGRQIEEKIEFLKSLETKAEEKPIIPCFRPYDWFEENDVVVCCIGEWKRRVVNLDFVTAKVIEDYRYKDGNVSVRCEKRVHVGEYLDGYGISYGLFRPEVMHEWEFEYLLKNLDFTEFWLKTKPPLREFNAEQILTLFTKESQNRFKKQR